MTAKLYTFKPRTRTKKERVESVAQISNMSIFHDVQEDVLGEWQRAAVRDQLNEYISSKLPVKLRVQDYDNLNALSEIEQKLGMKVASFYPGTTPSNPAGWMAAFHRGKEVFATPQMISEIASRSMNIVLCVSFEKTLRSLGRSK